MFDCFPASTLYQGNNTFITQQQDQKKQSYNEYRPASPSLLTQHFNPTAVFEADGSVHDIHQSLSPPPHSPASGGSSTTSNISNNNTTIAASMPSIYAKKKRPSAPAPTCRVVVKNSYLKVSGSRKTPQFSRKQPALKTPAPDTKTSPPVAVPSFISAAAASVALASATAGTKQKQRGGKYLMCDDVLLFDVLKEI